MSKIFEKHETLFCILLIVVYLLSNSLCVQAFGEISAVGLVVNTALSAGLLGLIFALKRREYYGLTRVEHAKKCLYFIPLVLILTVNLWNGIHITKSVGEIVLHILTMLHIGFIEEIIFRGFLFRMMEKTGGKSAVWVSSLTFGVGHVINLLGGAPLIPTLLQICYAVAIGYLFVIVFQKTGSLIPCIVTHSLMNALSVFNKENEVYLYLSGAFLIVVPIVYAHLIKRQYKK
jgi:membrane protease YdiL (CAAX protease family)